MGTCCFTPPRTDALEQKVTADKDEEPGAVTEKKSLLVSADPSPRGLSEESKDAPSIAPPAASTDSLKAKESGRESGSAEAEPKTSAKVEPKPDVGFCRMNCGKPVQPGKTKKGNPFSTCCRSCALNPGLGLHDSTCGGATPTKKVREACKTGSRCRNRKKDHLDAEAHPLDADYAEACAKSKIEGEALSLKVIFDWTDADGSGKLSKEELAPTLAIISRLCGEFVPEITEAAWQHLDEDGNGVVNFSEFATFFGPRLGLPLGMQRLQRRLSHGSSSITNGGEVPRPCSVLGCPCEAFCETTGIKDDVLEKGGFSSKRKCKVCRHKKEMHVSPVQEGEVAFPDYWDHLDTSGGEFHEIRTMPQGSLQEFQQVLERTYRNAWTRDRTRHNPSNPAVPRGFRVTAVKRNENSKNWEEYYCRRLEVQQREAEFRAAGQEALDKYLDIKSMVAYREAGGAKADRLIHDINEWYVFHGTNPESAKQICANDFKVSRAGSCTGSLYGKGLYFAESITKADEYAKPNDSGVYAVLFCRVLGGRVRYDDSMTPDPEDLLNGCIEGPYDCVLGDREKVKGTYREVVLFDSEDVYPEYIIEYQRLY